MGRLAPLSPARGPAGDVWRDLRPHASLDLRRLFWHHWTIMGSTMGNAAEYAEVVRRLGQGELRPVVDRTFPLERVREAYERLAKGQQWGKVVVEVSS